MSEDDENEDQTIFLPPHLSCSSHTLNLVCTTDAKVVGKDKKFKRSYNLAMAKCVALSNTIHRSPKAAEIVKHLTGRTIPKPVCTR